jgi:predicted transcriptional regulator YdeE
MNTQQIQQFHIIGISVRTTNENQQAIPELWNKFITEGIAAKISTKGNDDIYCVYTEYEKDHTHPYTAVIGCRVKDLKIIPEGMVGTTIHSGTYKIFTAKGNIMHGAVYNEWMNIWNTKLKRAYTTDYEVYGVKAKNLEDAEVAIYIALD